MQVEETEVRFRRISAGGFEDPRTSGDSEAARLASQPSSLRVLVAEDDDDLRALICDELRREGFEVGCCGTAREAVRHREWIHAMAGDPWSLDVVVTDLRLGEIDGLALLQRVSEAGVDVPVVVISAFGDLRARMRAADLGAAAFVDKPVEMQTLRSLVHKLALERRRRVLARERAARPRRRGARLI